MACGLNLATPHQIQPTGHSLPTPVPKYCSHLGSLVTLKGFGVPKSWAHASLCHLLPVLPQRNHFASVSWVFLICQWVDGQPKRVVVKVEGENECEAQGTEFGTATAVELWPREARVMLWP